MINIEHLAQSKCKRCDETDRLNLSQIEDLIQLYPGWTLSDQKISKDFSFSSYKSGLDFAYAIGIMAEDEDHHPNIFIGWRKVRLTLTTHIAKGLTMNDFIVAAKSELMYNEVKA